MVTFLIDKKKVHVPTRWADVTLQQAIDLSANKNADVVVTLSILTGLPYDTCYRLRTGDVDALITPVLQWLNEDVNEQDLLNQRPPEIFQLGDSRYFLRSFKPGAMIYAQHLNLETIVNDKQRKDIDKVAPCIAICVQNPEKYSEERQKVIEQLVGALPLSEAFAIAGFFLAKFLSFSNKPSSASRIIQLNKYGRELRTLRDSEQ